MKGKLSIAIVLVLFSLGFPSPGQAEGFIKDCSFRFSLGLGNTMGGDMVEIIDGLNKNLFDRAPNMIIPLEGQLANVNWGPELEGEFLLGLSENFAVSLGFNYVTRRKHLSHNLSSSILNTAGSLEWEPKYTAFPINLSIYTFLPISQKVSAFIRAGAGYYFARVEFDVREQNFIIDGGESTWAQTDAAAKNKAIGYHGSIGFEYDISRNITIFIEGIGRYANFKNWDVQLTFRDSKGDSFEMEGDFWYVEEYYYDHNQYYPTLRFDDGKPLDKWLRNVRKANISFSGISLRTGIKVGLGKK